MTPRAHISCILLICLMASGSLMAFDPQKDPYSAERRRMVEEQIMARDVSQVGVLDAMQTVPRHFFVPEPIRDSAYRDRPLPIGSHQTISQPYIVALMTSLLELDGDERVLEIGTGSGYQAAILSRLAKRVYTIEIRPELAKSARATLTKLGYDNIEYKVGDGYEGWEEAAPFDGIIVTAAPPEIPAVLVEQLAEGGRMVVPVGRGIQNLVVLTKTAEGLERETVAPVRFVPMITNPDN
jgi:protein-L-isoaspartate(D-aspartate) O-methyltransferase